MKELTAEEFDKKLKDNINLSGGLCICGIGGVSIIIKDGLCGTGVYAECPFCGTKKKLQHIHIYCLRRRTACHTDYEKVLTQRDYERCKRV